MNITGNLVKPDVAKKVRGRWTTKGKCMVIMVLKNFCLFSLQIVYRIVYKLRAWTLHIHFNNLDCNVDHLVMRHGTDNDQN
jgi:hypothetical protein